MKEKIVILGGGVIGLATAFELRKHHYDVTIVEKNSCGGQASGAAAGMLAPFSEIGEDPDDFFTFCLKSLRLYDNWQKEITYSSKMEFEYTNCGSLHAVYHEADVLALETRQAWQKEFGVEAEIFDRGQLDKVEPSLSDEVVAAIHYPEETHLYSPAYVRALEEACRKEGVHIYNQLVSVKIEQWRDHISLRAENGQKFTGDKLIVCSGAWAQELEEEFDLRIPVFPIRGQICAYENVADQLNHIIFTSQGYVVGKANGSIVNGASEDIAGFSSTVTEKGIARLTNWNKRILPFLEALTPYHTWAGLRPATQDGFPLIGQLEGAEHIIFATGHYRNGILLSPITAKTVTAIVEQSILPSEIRLFHPQRFT